MAESSDELTSSGPGLGQKGQGGGEGPSITISDTAARESQSNGKDSTATPSDRPGQAPPTLDTSLTAISSPPPSSPAKPSLINHSPHSSRTISPSNLFASSPSPASPAPSGASSQPGATMSPGAIARPPVIAPSPSGTTGLQQQHMMNHPPPATSPGSGSSKRNSALMSSSQTLSFPGSSRPASPPYVRPGGGAAGGGLSTSSAIGSGPPSPTLSNAPLRDDTKAARSHSHNLSSSTTHSRTASYPSPGSSSNVLPLPAALFPHSTIAVNDEPTSIFAESPPASVPPPSSPAFPLDPTSFPPSSPGGAGSSGRSPSGARSASPSPHAPTRASSRFPRDLDPISASHLSESSPFSTPPEEFPPTMYSLNFAPTTTPAFTVSSSSFPLDPTSPSAPHLHLHSSATSNASNEHTSLFDPNEPPSAIFERSVLHASTTLPLTAHEALDVAIPPVLDEAAEAIVSGEAGVEEEVREIVEAANAVGLMGAGDVGIVRVGALSHPGGGYQSSHGWTSPVSARSVSPTFHHGGGGGIAIDNVLSESGSNYGGNDTDGEAGSSSGGIGGIWSSPGTSPSPPVSGLLAGLRKGGSGGDPFLAAGSPLGGEGERGSGNWISGGSRSGSGVGGEGLASPVHPSSPTSFRSLSPDPPANPLPRRAPLAVHASVASSSSSNQARGRTNFPAYSSSDGVAGEGEEILETLSSSSLSNPTKSDNLGDNMVARELSSSPMIVSSSSPPSPQYSGRERKGYTSGGSVTPQRLSMFGLEGYEAGLGFGLPSGGIKDGQAGGAGSASKEKRRLSFVSMADIINSERTQPSVIDTPLSLSGDTFDQISTSFLPSVFSSHPSSPAISTANSKGWLFGPAGEDGESMRRASDVQERPKRSTDI